MQNKHRNVQGSTRGQDAGRAPEKTKRSGWFDDKTLEIKASTPIFEPAGIHGQPGAVGKRMSKVRPILRKVYLDHRGEAEPKIEGSWRKALLFWKTERWKKLLKV